MKGRGVVGRLFGLTSSVLILLFVLISVGQLFFFEDFYKFRQSKALEESTREFAELYRNREKDEEVIQAVSTFLNENKAQIAVVNEIGNYLFDNPFKIVMVLADGSRVTVPLYVYRESEQLLKANLKPGDAITVTGLFQYEGSKTIFYSTEIVNESGRTVLRRPEHSAVNMQVLTGEIESVALPPPNQWNIREGVFNFAIFGNFPLSDSELRDLRAGNVVSKNWIEPWSNAPNLILLHPILQNGSLSAIVMAVSSVAELETTYESLKVYYVYFGIGVVALILLLSIFYSRIVTKPLLSLNEAAIRLENMDFSAVEPLDRKDEFGVLSRNLNSIARKLDSALSKLKEANSRLLSDIERKEQIEKIQQAFISDVSHELKTPLSIIGSYAEGLKEEVAVESRDDYIDVILDECGRMESLIVNMLMLMRHDSDMGRFRPEAVRLHDRFERLSRRMEVQAADCNLVLKVQPTHDYVVLADPALLDRVLLNLFSNAIRHARSGSLIEIRTEETVSETLRIEVENRGDPIPNHHLERIWDRFYQVEEDRTRSEKGSGLGLAIVKQMIKDHGQSCGAYNVKDGVVFWFTLEQYRYEEENRAIVALNMKKPGRELPG